MHRIIRTALLAGTALAMMGAAHAKTCKPEDFGAAHDGKTLDTAAIQKAIDACGAGDVILLSQGSYLSGPLTLQSGDTLEVAKGAMLLGTPDHAAYRDAATGRPIVPLIGAHDASNITLKGEGTIDGNGAAWWGEFRAAKAAGRDAEYLRPKMIILDHIENLTVTGLTLQNSPMFHLVPAASHNVRIDHLTIKAPGNSPNTDGIDPSGRDMIFSNLLIDVGDDNIAIKSGRDDKDHPGSATANLIIRDCVFLQGHGLSIGSETNGGVENVKAENISFNGTKQAIRIKTPRGRGGHVRDISYHNISMENVGQAVLITGYYPKIPDTDTAQPAGPRTPDIHNITIDHLTVKSAESAGGLYGLPEKPLHDIVLKDVSIKAKKGLTVRLATGTLQGSIEAEAGPAIIAQEAAALTVTK